MTEAMCGVGSCDRPVRDTTICGACAGQLEKALGDIPALAGQLDITITRQSRIGDGAGRRSAERPLVFHTAASDLRAEICNELAGWVRLLQDQPEPDKWPADTLAGMSAWLLARSERIQVHPAAGEIAEAMTAAVSDAERVIDRSPERWYAGPCECGTHLYARPAAAQVRCRECGAIYDVAARREWLLAAAEDQLAHAALVAQALTRLGQPVKVDRIYGWARPDRSRIVPHGVDALGRPLYRIGDVLDLLAQDAQGKKAS